MINSLFMHSGSFPHKSEEVCAYPWVQSFVPYSLRGFWETVFHKLIYGSNCNFPLLVNVIRWLGTAGGGFLTKVFFKSFHPVLVLFPGRNQFMFVFIRFSFYYTISREMIIERVG